MPDKIERMLENFGNWTVQKREMVLYWVTGKTDIMTILKGEPYL
jgi:hypothetical protein